MLFIIVAIIIGFIWGWLEFEEITPSIIFSAIGCFFGMILYMFLGGLIGYFLPTVEVIEEQEICALNDTSEIEGQRFLFSGYIDKDLVFRYITNTNKGKHIKEIKGTENVYINEGDYVPAVRIVSYEFVKKWYCLFAYPPFDVEYIFFVPENTVTNEYNIDLQ